MNREQRRKAEKAGVNLNGMNTPCTIVEAVQLARGVAEDVVADYQSRTRHLNVSLALQVEILKDLMIKSGNITEEEYRKIYMEKVDEFNKKQKEAMEKASADSTADVEMSMRSDDVNVETYEESK